LALARNIFLHGGSSAAASIALFALHVTAARFLGAVDYGYYSFGLAFAPIVWIIVGYNEIKNYVYKLKRDYSLREGKYKRKREYLKDKSEIDFIYDHKANNYEHR